MTKPLSYRRGDAREELLRVPYVDHDFLAEVSNCRNFIYDLLNGASTSAALPGVA